MAANFVKLNILNSHQYFRIDKERQHLKAEVDDLSGNIEMLQRSKVSSKFKTIGLKYYYTLNPMQT